MLLGHALDERLDVVPVGHDHPLIELAVSAGRPRDRDEVLTMLAHRLK